MVDSNIINTIHAFFFCFRGLFQYGDLHFGHTLGVSPLLRGTHSCPHRSHLYPLNNTLAMNKGYITNSI